MGLLPDCPRIGRIHDRHVEHSRSRCPDEPPVGVILCTAVKERHLPRRVSPCIRTSAAVVLDDFSPEPLE
jgi:hypothetical protein